MALGTIPRPQVTLGELSVPATVGGPIVPAKNGAGLWGLVASQTAELDQLKAAGPASTAAVVGQSETADPAVFGSNPNGMAGFFKGQVEVTGNINCADVILKNGMPLSQLTQSLNQLTQLVQQMGMTQYGQPIPAPTSRPSINLTNKFVGQDGAVVLSIDGSPGVNQLHFTRTNPSFPPTGDVSGPPFQIQVFTGELVTVWGTNKANDPYDVTGLLWSFPPLIIHT